MPFQVFTVDLSTVGQQDLVARDRQISEMFILDMPAGARVQVRPGPSTNRDWISVTRPFTMEPTGDDGAGLSINVDTAQAGVQVELTVVFAGQLGTILT